MSVTKSTTENTVIYSLGEEKILEASFEKHEETTLKIKGAIKTLAAPYFNEVIKAALSRNEPITIDFSEVSYIASAGLRVLLDMQQLIDEDEKPKIEIANITEAVKEVFEQTGFINILNVKL